MIKFSREKVLLLHQLLAEATGGSVGVRVRMGRWDMRSCTAGCWSMKNKRLIYSLFWGKI